MQASVKDAYALKALVLLVLRWGEGTGIKAAPQSSAPQGRHVSRVVERCQKLTFEDLPSSRTGLPFRRFELPL